MRTLTILSLALLLSSFSASALAKGQPRPGGDKRYCHKHLPVSLERLRSTFQTLDLDHDGYLTVLESDLPLALRKCFRALDRDRDHRLSSDELGRT